MTAPEPEKKPGFNLMEWLGDAARKILPWVLMGIIGAGIGLFVDNIGNKRDIARETWRNDKQDERIARIENRDDRQDEAISEVGDTQNEFQNQALHRLDLLLEAREQKVRRGR